MDLERSLGGSIEQLEVNRFVAQQRLIEYLKTPREVLLREHQIDTMGALDKFLEKDGDAGYISLPTGSGKTVLIAEITQALGMKTLILSPTQQILEQTRGTIETFTPETSVSDYYTRKKDLTGKVLNTTYQSLPGLIREGKINPSEFELVFCDEAHTALGEKRHTIFREFNNAVLLGLTATPYFTPLEGYIKRGLVDPKERWTGLFKNLIHEMPLEEAIERGVLANLDVYLLKTNTRVENVRITSTGEYDRTEIERYLNTQARNYLTLGMVVGSDRIPEAVRISRDQRELINRIHEEIRGKRTVIFGLGINHVEELAKKLKEEGVKAEAVHGQMDPARREEILKTHSQGEIPVVLGVDMLRLGWDSPPTEVGIYLAPTRSGIVAVQELGRILRLSPQSRKERAIAIQMVDQYRPDQAPVLIPNIFDPYYVLRGMRTGKEIRRGVEEGKKIQPTITFLGMNIEPIMEEARSQELLRHRFKRASVQEINGVIEDMSQKIKADNPQISLFKLYQTLAEQIPQRLGIEIEEPILQAVASLDSNTAKEGEKALFYLNLRTIFTAIEAYLLEGEEDEVLQTAMTAVAARLKKLNPNLRISQQINMAAKMGAAQWVAYSKDMPTSWVKDPEVYQKINEVLETEFFPGRKIPLTGGEIEALAQSLSQETGVGFEEIRDYLTFRNSRKSFEPNDKDLVSEGDSTVLRAAKNILDEQIENILSSLRTEEREIIRERFLENKTLAEVGREHGIVGETVKERGKKALRKLRHPSRSRHLKDWEVNLEDGITIIVPAEKPDLSRKLIWKTEPLPYSLKKFGLGSMSEQLKSVGLREIGDLFSAEPQEILEGWFWEKKELREVLAKVISHPRIQSAYRESQFLSFPVSRAWSPEDPTVEDRSLLYHLSGAVIDKDREKALKVFPKLTRMVVEKSQGILDESLYTELDQSLLLAVPPTEFTKIDDRARQIIFRRAYEELEGFVSLLESEK